MKRIAVSAMWVAGLPAAVLCLGLFGATAVAGVGPTAGMMAYAAALTAQSDGGSGAMGGYPMVELRKSCPDLRYLGRDASFEIVVRNRGDGAAKNVVVTDTLTGSIEFVSADNGGSRQGNRIVWNLGTLGAGEERTLRTNYRCTQIGVVRNSANVSYCAESAAECAMEVKGIPAILLECVDNPDPIEVNGSVTYTITVTNQGTAVGTNIVIECTLPEEEEHVSATGPTNSTVAGKMVTFAPLPTLAPKANAVYKVTVKGTAVGDVRFRVELTSDQIETPVMETESTHIY